MLVNDKLRNLHLKMVAGVRVDAAIFHINQFMWSELGGYVSLAMANRMLAVPTLIMDHELLLKALLEDVNTRTLDAGENRVYCDWSDPHWKVAVGSDLLRNIKAICDAAQRTEVVVKWHVCRDAVTCGSALKQDDVLMLGECNRLNNGGLRVTGVTLEVQTPLLKTVGALPVICDTGKKVNLYNGAHLAFDADHGTVSTCFYSRESIWAAIIAMRENAIENHKG